MKIEQKIKKRKPNHICKITIRKRSCATCFFCYKSAFIHTNATQSRLNDACHALFKCITATLLICTLLHLVDHQAGPTIIDFDIFCLFSPQHFFMWGEWGSPIVRWEFCVVTPVSLLLFCSKITIYLCQVKAQQGAHSDLFFFPHAPTCVTAQSTATGLFSSSGHSFCHKHFGKFSNDTL